MTPNDLKAVFSRYKKDTSDVFVGGNGLWLNWCDRVNRMAYRVLFNSDPEQYMTTHTYTITSGTASYAMPDNFETISALGSGVFIVDDGTDTDTSLPKTGFGSPTLGYYINGLNLVLTPVPTTTATYKLRYIPTLESIIAMDDTLVIPDEFMYYAQDAIDVLYSSWDGDEAAEAAADQRFMRSLAEFIENIRNDSPAAGIETFFESFY